MTNNYRTGFPIGSKFNNWELIEILSTNHHGMMRWKCKCSCGDIYEMNASTIANNDSFGCRKCFYKRMGKNQSKPIGEGSANILFHCYKKGARDRNLSFKLSFENFLKITKQNCFYCNKVPSQISKGKKYSNGPYIFNGIDRLRNNIGYTNKNTVSCCGHCNWAKSNLSVQNFLKWVEKTYNFFILKNVSKNKNNKTIKLTDGTTAGKCIYHSYKWQAKKRKLLFDLNFNDFNKLARLNCYYCNKPPNQIALIKKHKYIYNGVDRLNNLIGYQIDNCVPCCGQCNMCKSDYSLIEFIDWLTNIYNYKLKDK